MVTFELDKNATLTSKEKSMLTEARKLPVSYDSDSPELSDDMEKAFVAARKAIPSALTGGGSKWERQDSPHGQSVS